MRNTKKETPNRLWIYVSVMAVLLGVLAYLIFTQGGSPAIQPQPNPSTGEGVGGSDSTTPGTVNTTPSNRSEKGGVNKEPDQSLTDSPDRQSGQGSSDNNSQNTATARGSYAPLGCSAETQKACTIKNDDLLYEALGQRPESGLLVNGEKVRPATILYRTSLYSYNDEQMKDGQGKILSSTKKEYDASSKTLTITVGVNADYYNNLKQTEQRLLYLSQTVRSFMAMFGETPDNFVKVERVVGNLGSWQPTP